MWYTAGLDEEAGAIEAWNNRAEAAIARAGEPEEQAAKDVAEVMAKHGPAIETRIRSALASPSDREAVAVTDPEEIKGRAASVLCEAGALCGWPAPNCNAREGAEALYRAGLLALSAPGTVQVAKVTDEMVAAALKAFYVPGHEDYHDMRAALTAALALSAPGMVQEERNAFEAWAKSDHRDIQQEEYEERTPDNYQYYQEDSTNHAYIGWHSRAIAASKGPSMVDIVREEIIGDCRLILGDCTECMSALYPAAGVLVDPPFGISYRSGWRTEELWSGDDIKGDNSTALRDYVLARLHPRPTLAFGSWKAQRPHNTRAVLIWDKGPALGMGALDIPWKPSFEEIYVLGKGFAGTRDEGAVLLCPPVQSTAKNGRSHPNEKPVDLLKRLLRKMPDGLICDPFMGSGSVGVACALTGRPFVGVEIDERYFDIACERIRKAYAQPDMFVERPAQPIQEQLFGGQP